MAQHSHKRTARRPPILITQTEPRSAASEAYRMLRTNIQFAGLDQAPRNIVFTSAGPGEGKTTSVANFGVVAAEAGSRVCLVDADLGRAARRKLFGVENRRGPSTALLRVLPSRELGQRMAP